MKRPILYIAIYFVIGIFLAFLNHFVLALAILTLAGLSYFLAKKYKMKKLNLLTILPILAVFLTNLSLMPKNAELEDFCKQQYFLQVSGVVTKLEQTKSGAKKLTIKTKKIKADGKEVKEKIKILAYIYDDISFYDGEEIELFGQFNKPYGPKNPTGYNEEKIFKIKNIEYKMYPKYYKLKGVKNKFTYYISKVNEKISDLLYELLPKTEAAILSGILLGNRSEIDEETLDVYRSAGIYHILAISGMHITILAGFLSKIFKGFSRRYSNIIVIIILVMYCIFTGASTSTIRATIMAAVTLLGSVFYKRYDLISSACFSALLLLIYEPMYIFDMGFLYSFCCVFTIAFLGAKVSELKNMPSFLKPISLTFFVCLAIKPITMYNFYTFNTLDLFLNLLILPFMSFVVSIGFLSILAAFINFKLATIIINIAYLILRFFTYICTVVDRMEFANILVGKPRTINIISFYIMLLVLAFVFYDKHLIYKRKKYIKGCILIFLSTFVFTSFYKKPFELTNLSFDKGECVVSEYGSSAFIFDLANGPSGGGQSDIETVLLPYLKSRGIKKLDAVFITKNSYEYINGVAELLEKRLVKIEKIFVPLGDFENGSYYDLFEKANDRKIPVFSLKNDDKIEISDELNFEILHPFKDETASQNSLIFKINYLEKSILFAGDKGLDELQKASIKADILKLSGNDFDEIENISNKIRPEIIILNIDTPKNQKERKFLQIFNTDDVRFFNIHEDGALNIKIYKDSSIKTKVYK